MDSRMSPGIRANRPYNEHVVGIHDNPGVLLAASSPEYNNITQGAFLYSTLASVLAGFAFTAIVLLVVTWLGESSRRARWMLADVGIPLVASFFGLLIMAVSYAAEATGTQNDELTASENTILAAGFAGVGVLLLYTVVLMLDKADESAAHRLSGATSAAGAQPDEAGRIPGVWEVARFARVSACLLNLLILGFGYNATTLYEEYRYKSASPSTAIDKLGWLLLAIEAVVMLRACWVIMMRPANGMRSSTRTPMRLISYGGLGLPAASGAGYLIADSVVAENDTIPPLGAATVLISIFVVTTIATWCLASTRRSRDTSEPEFEQQPEPDGRPPRFIDRLRPGQR